MTVVPQYATETADGAGDAVFVFPTPPQGETWCGTTNILGAPGPAVGTVTAGGQNLGETIGNGTYGPWTCNYSQTLVISVTGLTPDTQYQAVWHADTAAATYPAPITQVVIASVNVPEPLEIIPTLAGAGTVASGQVTMTGAAIQLPPHAALNGLILSTLKSNTEPVLLGPAGVTLATGFIIEPGAITPPLPVVNADVLYVIGAADDVVSFLVL